MSVTKLDTSHQKSSKTIWLILDTLHRAQFSAIWYISYFYLFLRWRKDHQNSIKLTYSRFSQQIYINLWLHQYFIFSLTGASLKVSLVNWILGHGLAKGSKGSKGHRKAQSSRHNVWRARQDPSGTPVECPLGDSRRCPGRRLETYRNDRRPWAMCRSPPAKSVIDIFQEMENHATKMNISNISHTRTRW